MKDSIHSGHLMEDLTQIIDGTAIYTYIDPSNHPNVYIYMAYMECLGKVYRRDCSRLPVSEM